MQIDEQIGRAVDALGQLMAGFLDWMGGEVLWCSGALVNMRRTERSGQ